MKKYNLLTLKKINLACEQPVVAMADDTQLM